MKLQLQLQLQRIAVAVFAQKVQLQLQLQRIAVAARPKITRASARARALRARSLKNFARACARRAKRQKMFIGSRAVSLTPANCDAKVRGRSCKRLKWRIACVEKEMRKAKKIKSNSKNLKVSNILKSLSIFQT